MPEVPFEDLLAPVRKYSIVIIGNAKEGKTQSFWTFYQWLCETNAESKEIQVYDFDDGAEALIRKFREGGVLAKKHLRVFRYARPGGDKIDIGPTRQRSQAEFLTFMREFNQLYELVDPRTGKWKDPANSPGLVLIDGITILRDIVYDYVLSVRGKDLGGGQGSGITFTEQVMFKEKVLGIINAARGLPCHCAFTCHVEMRQEMAKGGGPDADPTPTGETYRVPIIFGDLRSSLTSLFDVALYTTMPNFKWKTTGDGHMKGVGVRVNEKLPVIMDQDFRLVFGTSKIKPVIAVQSKTEADKPSPAIPAPTASTTAAK